MHKKSVLFLCKREKQNAGLLQILRLFWLFQRYRIFGIEHGNRYAGVGSVEYPECFDIHAFGKGVFLIDHGGGGKEDLLLLLYARVVQRFGIELEFAAADDDAAEIRSLSADDTVAFQIYVGGQVVVFGIFVIGEEPFHQQIQVGTCVGLEGTGSGGIFGFGGGGFDGDGTFFVYAARFIGNSDHGAAGGLGSDLAVCVYRYDGRRRACEDQLP